MIARVLILFGVLCLFSCAPANPNIYRAQVIRVVDGDTLVVQSKQKGVEKIRLADIDCPEAKTQQGPAATARTRQLADGKTVTIRARGLGRYRRTIAEIILPGGDNLGQLLLTEQLAVPYGR